MSILKDGRILLSFRILTACAQIIIGILLARWLGPHDRGVFALLVFLPTICGQLGAFGLDITNAFYCSQSASEIRNILQQSLSLQLLIAGFLFAGLMIFSGLFSEMNGLAASENLLRWLALIIPFMLFVQNMGGILWGEKRFFELGLLNLLRPVSFLAGLFLIQWLAKISVSNIIPAYIVSFIIPAVFLGIYLKNHLNFARPGDIDLKLLLNSSLPVWIAQICGLAYFRLDLLILNFWWGRTVCGYFAVMFFIAEGIGLVGSTAAEVLFPYAGQSIHRGDTKFLSKALLLTLSITILLLVVVTLAGAQIVEIAFGEKFRPMLPALMFLLPGILFRNGLKVVSMWLISHKKMKTNAAINVLGVIIIFIANMILIPKYGLSAAAIVNSLAFFALFVSSYLVALRSHLTAQLTELIH